MADKKIIVSYCMTCGKIKINGLWVLPCKPLTEYQLSHGYCDPCGKKAIAEARAQIAKMKIVSKP